MVQSASLNTIEVARPRRWGRVFIAGLLLGLDIFALPIWGLWLVASLRGSATVMTVQSDAPVPAGYALLFGPLAVASLVAVWLHLDASRVPDRPRHRRRMARVLAGRLRGWDLQWRSGDRARLDRGLAAVRTGPRSERSLVGQDHPRRRRRRPTCANTSAMSS